MPKAGRFQEEVYLAFSDILGDGRTLMRNPKRIRRFIKANTHHAEIQRLVEKHGIQLLGATVKALLEDQVFDSVPIARARFPNAFQTPTTQNALPVVSEPPAPQQRDASGQSTTERRPTQADVPMAPSTSTENGAQHSPDTSQVITEQPEVQPYSMPFPFQVQHHIFTKLQSILEGACYALAKVDLPHILSERNWDCPEAGELDRWTMVLLYYERERALLDQGIVASLEKPLVDLMKSIAQIRHDTVHRVHLTADKVLDYLTDAELFVKLLKADTALDVVSKIRRYAESAVGEMTRNQNMLEIWTGHTKTHFAAARAELDCEEDEVLSKAKSRHMEFDTWASTNLFEAVSALFEL